ncbi:MAG TPA: ribosome-associated translation inhibitor RaiA [Candidatus Paceibacterota bacterium]|nr:ribosome-associated translation inhibitor RaiA [Verrucomicrobiota bacterium]HRY46629.1 ribosome-associated translation inhibitor RaiA [Candidatus Paceibacterota bacterium]
MKFILSTHNVKLTQELEDRLLDRIKKLERKDHRAVEARVTIVHDKTKVPERQLSCSIRLAVRGPDLFAEDSESDLNSAIDLAMKKMEQQISKRRSKFKARKHSQAAATKRKQQDEALT